MASTDTNHLCVRLGRITELFAAPAVDPFAGWPQSDSGLERLLNQLRPRPVRPIHLTIELPRAQLSDDLVARTRAALQSYCSARIASLENDAVSMRREGLAALLKGLVFMALCMFGARLAENPQFVPAIVGRYLTEGFVIAGWVALWHPLDLLLYQRWPLRRDRRHLQQLQAAELEFSTPSIAASVGPV
jgi:hypothetical protein